MIGEIISAGASVLSGLFGRKKTETTEQTSTSTVDYKAMADAAVAGGFNPLAALRNGGTGGFVTTYTKGKNVTSGGASIGAGIADAAAQIAPLFGSRNASADPIKTAVKTKASISPLVSKQLAATRRAGSVVVAPRQTTRSSPVTSSKDVYDANVVRMNNGSFIGPRYPQGAGKDGAIENAMVAWRRSDGSIMYTYNPNFPDGDAAVAAGIADGLNRANDSYDKTFAYPEKPWAWPWTTTKRPAGPAQAGKWGRYNR